MSSSSPNFPNCSSPRRLASVYAGYLRSHFSVSQSKALCSRARGLLSEEPHSSFCSPFSPNELLLTASNLYLCTAIGPDKFAYPMLKHLPRSGMDFLLHIFYLSWIWHSFSFIWKTSSIIPIYKMGMPLDSPASFRPISLTSCISKLFERIILSSLLFFLESNSILSPRRTSFHPGRSTVDQILFFSQFISDGFNKPRPSCRTILSNIDFSKAFDSVWQPALFHKLISASLPPCFACWTEYFPSDRRTSMVYQAHKSRSFKSVEVFYKDSFLVLYFSLSSLMILRLLCLLPSATLFTITIWPFGPPPPRFPVQWRPHKEL